MLPKISLLLLNLLTELNFNAHLDPHYKRDDFRKSDIQFTETSFRS